LIQEADLVEPTQRVHVCRDPDDHELMTGEFVLKELNRVLIKKLKVPEPKVSNTLQFLHRYHVDHSIEESETFARQLNRQTPSLLDQKLHGTL
jgi:hypothetical protein